MKPNKQQIKQAIDDAGYLFEQQIGYKLKEHGYLVTPNHNFEDLETGDSREIDLYAVSGIVKEELDVDIWQLLLIECKKTSNPLIFFSKPQYEELRGFENYFDIVGAPESLDAGKGGGVLDLEQYLELSNLSHRYELSDTSSQFCKILRKGKNWEAKHEHLYNSMIVPLIKCLSSERKEYRESLPGEMIQLRIIYPVIVIESELCLMNTETGEISKKKWVLFYRHYDSKNVKLTAMIDFVRHKHLDEYLEKIASSFNSIVERVINRRRTLLSKIKAKKFYMED